MIGKTVSHYKIIEKLGEGEMGELYFAKNTSLKRQVAIKFLPEHLTKDKENIERFQREAEAAAALNHPNIITIYDVIETDGQLCIVMEYVDGDSLRTKIDNKDLAVEEILKITNQICEGLSEAHKADIVHRDIKPENILIDKRGRVKILDFGLAKLKGVSKLTKETSTLGTIHYMSPEQIQGKEVDNRSDIWSLGVVTYELLTGEPPFKGDYESAVHYAILNEEPKRLKDIEIKYSPEICELINRMIAKDVKERYQNCSNVLNDLNEFEGIKPKKRTSVSNRAYIFSGIAAIITVILLFVLFFIPKEEDEKSLRSLAVLPFINERNDPEIDYLGMSLADEIIGGLSYLQNINIRPSSSIRVYKDKLVDPMSAGKELSVDYILSGSHIKEKDIIRLNIELAHVYADTILWRYKIEENSQNTFQLIDIVSKKVIDGLKIRFSSEESQRTQMDIPKNPIAYEYYLRGVAFPRSVEGNHLAISMLLKSLNLDSIYAPALSEIGSRKENLAQFELGSSNLYNEAEKYYIKSLTINPELLSALNNLAMLYVDLGKSGEALMLTKKALKINPNHAITHFTISYLYRYAGMLNESKKAAEKALALAPSNERFRSIGFTYLYLGEYAKALNTFELGGQSAFTYERKGEIYFREGKIDSALRYFNCAINIEPFSFSGIFSKAIMAYIEQKKVEGLKMAKELEQSDPWDSEGLYTLASIYGLFGEKKRCSLILRKAVEGGFFNYPFMLKDTFFDPVRDDPEL
jgi:serine/threonine protein kinase/Tfp pilus assembly protein PilF